MTHSIRLAAAAVLASVSLASQADTFTAPLDLSTGNTSFGRNNAVGSFVDTYTFTLTGSSYFLTGTASSAKSGLQDLDFSSLVIKNSSNAIVATFDGNLGTSANEFYSLPEISLAAGSYSLVVTGVNSPAQASYSGNVAVTAAVPEPDTLALMLAGLAAVGFMARGQAARQRRG